MEIRRYQPLPPGRLIIMVILNLIFTSSAVVMFVVGAPAPAKAAAITAALATVFACWRFLQVHYRYAAKIAWYTRQGVAIIPGEVRDWLASYKTELEEHIDRPIRWWCNRLASTGVAHPDRIRDYVNGSELTVVVQEGPLVHPRTGEKARAFTDGKHVQIWYPSASDAAAKAYLKGYDTRTIKDLFFALVRHEFGHLPLNAVGVPPGEQHTRMEAEMFPDR